MNMKIRIAVPSLFGLAATILLLNACSKNDLSEPILKETTEQKSQFFVDQNEAVRLLSGEELTEMHSNARTSDSERRSVKEVRRFLNNDSKVMFSIVEYDNDKGFTLLSADKRMKPVLAFAEKGTFDEKTDNPGIQLWFDLIR